MIGGKLPRTALAVAILTLPTAALGGGGEDFFGGNLEGMGRAAVANPADTSSLAINPGAIALVERYDFEGTFDLGPTGDVEWSLAALDARTAPIAFGVAWRRTVADPPITLEEMPGWVEPGHEVDNRKRTHEFTAALAIPMLDRALSFGIGGLLFFRNDDRGGKLTTGNMDAGFAWKIDKLWTVGLAGRNLIPLAHQESFAAGLAAGVHWRNEYLGAWAFDIDAQFEQAEFPVSFRLGGEIYAGYFRGRLGYRFEGADTTHWLSPGIGFENKAGAVDFTVLVALSDQTRFVDLVYVWSIRVRL